MLTLGSHKREIRDVRTAGTSKGTKRNQKRYWDRPIGDMTWHGEKRRYIFLLERINLFEGLYTSLLPFRCIHVKICVSNHPEF